MSARAILAKIKCAGGKSFPAAQNEARDAGLGEVGGVLCVVGPEVPSPERSSQRSVRIALRAGTASGDQAVESARVLCKIGPMPGE